MDAILSSFCFTKSTLSGEGNYFHRMPPVCFRTWTKFAPDYSVLFLCEKFYVDFQTIERINSDSFFGAHKTMLDALDDCGRLEVRDFQQEINPYVRDIKEHVRNKTSVLTDWLPTFKRVVSIWEKFSDKVAEHYEPVWLDSERESLEKDGDAWEYQDSWPDERLLLDSIAGGMYEGLDSSLVDNLSHWNEEIPSYDRERVQSVISSYVEHVAANLCLSDVLNATVHDWEDIGPVYETTFNDTLRIGDRLNLARQNQVNRLLTVMFPEFEPKNVRSLAKVVDDPRLDSLRDIVNDAVEGRVTFDMEFANTILRDVISTEHQIGKKRNLVGWLTKPLGFIPYVGFAVDTIADKSIGKIIENKKRDKLSWFYLLSEINIDT